MRAFYLILRQSPCHSSIYGECVAMRMPITFARTKMTACLQAKPSQTTLTHIYTHAINNQPLISQSLILPCSFATANMSEPGEKATALILPNGVPLLGQFLYTVQEGR